jgi:hypothetical protein
MEWSPSEVDSSSSSQEIPFLLWKLEVHYRVYNNPLIIRISSQMNSVYAPIIFFQIYFNIILLSTPGSSK